MPDLQTFLHESALHHRGHLCPRQVLGARMGLYAGSLLGLALPQTDKRLFTFVETDGCFTDGIAASTGCWWGSRTLRLMDYGKIAATFVDTLTNRAIRISPSASSRQRSLQYAPQTENRWQAQLMAYQIMPDDELFTACEVDLTVSLQAIISKPGGRVICEECGEDIINERYIRQGERVLCIACAQGAYYSIQLNDPVLCSQGHLSALK